MKRTKKKKIKMDYNQTHDMYVVYMHKYGGEVTEIAGLFKSRENAEAYVQTIENNYEGHPLYIIKHAVTDF